MPGGVATALLEQTGGDGEPAIGLFEVDEAWLRERRRRPLPPHRAARQPVPRPARPLRRAGDARRRVERARRRARRAHVVRAERGRPAGRRPRPRRATATPRERVTYFGLEDRSHALERIEHASDAKHCRRCGTAYTYSAAYLGHLGDYSCPNCGNARPAAAGRRARRGAARHGGLALHARGAARARSRVTLRLPGLYNVYNALARRGLLPAARRRRSRRSSAASSPSPPRSAARSRSRSATAGWRSCWSRTPPARTRCSARSRPRTASAGSTCGSSSTTASPTGATSPGSGTRTSRRSRRTPARVVCSGTRAEELALRLKYAGVAPRAAGGGPGARARPRPRARRRRRRPALRPAHLHRAARAARRARRPRPRAAVLGMTRSRDLARHRVRRPTPPTSRCGRSCPATAPRDVLDLGCGTGRVALQLARRGRRVTGLDREPAAPRGRSTRARRAWRLRRRDGGADARVVRPRRASSTLVLAPMQLVQLFHGAGERRAMLERACARTCAPAACSQPR